MNDNTEAAVMRAFLVSDYPWAHVFIDEELDLMGEQLTAAIEAQDGPLVNDILDAWQRKAASIPAPPTSADLDPHRVWVLPHAELVEVLRNVERGLSADVALLELWANCVEHTPGDDDD